MEWFYSKNGVQLGPVSREDLLQKQRNREVLPTDLVWRHGMDDWTPLGQVRELSENEVAASTAEPTFRNPQGVAPTGKIDNYLWQSIAVTVMCCLPFGIVAIIYASKVDGLVAKGDIAGAMAASKSAKMWVNVSVGACILAFIFVLLSSAVGGMA